MGVGDDTAAPDDMLEMPGWRNAWAVWAGATLASVPASAFLWLVGGMAACGGEVYDAPPGSFGDSFCQSLVDPVVPWASIAAVPFFLAALGGPLAIRMRNRRLFVVALTAPFLLAAAGILVALAAL